MNSFLMKVITSEDVCAVWRKSYLSANVVLMGRKLKPKSTSQKQDV